MWQKLAGQDGAGRRSLFQNGSLADLIQDLGCSIPAASELRGMLPSDNAARRLPTPMWSLPSS